MGLVILKQEVVIIVTKERLLETLAGRDGFDVFLELMLLLINSGVITLEDFDQAVSKTPRY